MLKLCRVTKVKVFFLVLVFVFNFDLFKFSTAMLEKGLLIMKIFITVISISLISFMFRSGLFDFVHKLTSITSLSLSELSSASNLACAVVKL